MTDSTTQPYLIFFCRGKRKKKEIHDACVFTMCLRQKNLTPPIRNKEKGAQHSVTHMDIYISMAMLSHTVGTPLG